MEIRRYIISSDNGIYILQSTDGYRVIHAQAIENLYWWKQCCNKPGSIDAEDDNGFYYHKCTNCGSKIEYIRKNELNPEILLEYFGKSKVFKTNTEVFTEATRLYEKTLLLEYGISFIRGWEDKDFPKEKWKSILKKLKSRR